jgi:hypothetical protein
MNESIGGNGLVERQIATNNAKFYIIKHDGYCGFFLTSEKGTYICAGGRIKKISKCSDITKFNIEFANMIRTYLRIVSPYRNVRYETFCNIKEFVYFLNHSRLFAGSLTPQHSISLFIQTVRCLSIFTRVKFPSFFTLHPAKISMDNEIKKINFFILPLF